MAYTKLRNELKSTKITQNDQNKAKEPQATQNKPKRPKRRPKPTKSKLNGAKMVQKET